MERMSSVITLRIQTDDAIIVKYIEHGQVKTETIIDGKVTYIQRKDIKRLGYNSEEELIDSLKRMGYQIQ